LKVLGISPLDKDATASLVIDGRHVFAAGEERFTRQKQQSGFPRLAIEAALDHAGLKPADLDAVAYGFLPAAREVEHIDRCFEEELKFNRAHANSPAAKSLPRLLGEAKGREPARSEPIHGLPSPNQRMGKGRPKELLHSWSGVSRAGVARFAPMASTHRTE